MVRFPTYLLSGGKSSRMGEDKGLKLLSGKPMICYVLDTLQKLGITPTIIANRPDYHKFGTPVIADKIQDKGPLGGIYTALCDAQHTVLVLSADMPFISTSAIEYLLENQKENAINIVNSNGKIQPLCGIYPFGLLPKIETELHHNNLKLMTFLAENDANTIPLTCDTAVFSNINTPEDIVLAEKRISINIKH